MGSFKNKNRGYQQLRVWQDAIEYYAATSRVFRGFPFELKKVASQQFDCVDGVHRNIAEGYCRRSIREYIQFLYVALGSLGESVSGLHGCRAAEQIWPADFDSLNATAFKVENELLNFVESLERKRDEGTWQDTLVAREPGSVYGCDSRDVFALSEADNHHSSTPLLHHSKD
jgi:four helix bundle protein